MAAIRAPRRYEPVLLEERRPRGNDPRGPLRGDPERSAKDPQTPSKSTTENTTRGDKVTNGEAKARKKPTIATIEESGRERKWGPLSRANAWRAGTFWEDMDREVKVFIVEEDKRKEVDVEKRLGGGKRAVLVPRKCLPTTRTQRRRRQPDP